MREAARERRGVALVCLGVLVVSLGVGLLRYYGLESRAYDLGFFDQVVERTAAGHPWESSFITYSFLGQHWEPVLWLPAQLDRLVPSPVWLLLLQAGALAAAPWFAWRLARAWLPGSGRVPLLAAVATALSPLLGRGAAFDFHSEAFTPVLALAALDGAARRSTAQLVLCSAALALVKEDALLVAVGVGWLVLVAERRPTGLLLSVAAALAFVVVTAVAMPHLRMGAAGDLAQRYAYLGGDTLPAMLRGAVTHPLVPLRAVLSTPALLGLATALLPLALLPLRAPLALLSVAPPLAVALLSNDPAQASLRYHYGMEVFPLLMACALLGVRAGTPQSTPAWLRTGIGAAAEWLGRFAGPSAIERRMGLAALCSAVGFAVLAVPWLTAASPSQLSRTGDVLAVLAAVPAEDAVAATSDLVPHLSNRAEIYEFPTGFGVTDVVIDDRGGVSAQSYDAGYRARLAQLPTSGYHRVISRGGVTLWRLSAAGPPP